MNGGKLIDRYEPLNSILTFYKRFGQSSHLVRHIARFIDENIKVKKKDRRALFDCMFKQQQDKEKKIKNFIATIAEDLDIYYQEDLIEHLIISLKSRIDKIRDPHMSLVHQNHLNDRLYKQINVLQAFQNNHRDFETLFNLWFIYV